jgi:ribonuclease P/MRP protein subunit RPP1
MPDKSLKFIDLCVHSLPEGASSIQRFIGISKKYGYNGICVTNHMPFYEDIEGNYEPVEGFDVYQGVEVVANNASELRKNVDRLRNRVDVLCVHGGEEPINRAACEDDRVDILSHPHEGKTGGINHILAKLAADKFVAIEFDMSYIICGRGGSRVRALSNYRKNFSLVKKFGSPYILTSRPLSIYDMRDVRSMIALASLFGMSANDALKGISHYPAEIIRRNTGGSGFIMEGVELVS